MHVRDLVYPVVAFSPAGWDKEASEVQELTDASPDDDLLEWQGIEVVDATGTHYRALRVYRAWPRSTWGVWLCRLANNCIHVDMDLVSEGTMPLDNLKARMVGYYGDASQLAAATTHREVIELYL